MAPALRVPGGGRCLQPRRLCRNLFDDDAAPDDDVSTESNNAGSAACAAEPASLSETGRDYWLSASTRRSMRSSTVPDLGRSRSASLSDSSALGRPAYGSRARSLAEAARSEEHTSELQS